MNWKWARSGPVVDQNWAGSGPGVDRMWIGSEPEVNLMEKMLSCCVYLVSEALLDNGFGSGK